MCAHFLRFEKPEVTTLWPPRFQVEAVLIHVDVLNNGSQDPCASCVVCDIRLQVSGLWSLPYVRSEEQPSALLTGTVQEAQCVGSAD